MSKPLLAVTVAAALVLTGCGSGSSSSGEVRLRMIESLTSPERTKLIKSLLAGFEQANPVETTV